MLALLQGPRLWPDLCGYYSIPYLFLFQIDEPQSQEDEVHLRSIHYKTNGSLIARFGLSMIPTQKIEMALHSPDIGILRK
jgi:hypothetical protein